MYSCQAIQAIRGWTALPDFLQNQSTMAESIPGGGLNVRCSGHGGLTWRRHGRSTYGNCVYKLKIRPGFGGTGIFFTNSARTTPGASEKEDRKELPASTSFALPNVPIHLKRSSNLLLLQNPNISTHAC